MTMQDDLNRKEQMRLKAGALHLRLMDNQEQYDKMLALLNYYRTDNKQYAEDVLDAMKDGLKNYERYLHLENALSPRCISIVKRELPEGEKLNAADTEGAYHMVLRFDDGKEEVVHFDRKASQLLYMLIVLCAMKNGYVADFLHKPCRDEYEDEKDFDEDYECFKQNKETVTQLAQMVYPNSKVDDLWKNLCPDTDEAIGDSNSCFTDLKQKMRSTLGRVLNGLGQQEESMWFIPLDVRYGKDIVYKLRMSTANILFPKEMTNIVTNLPDAKDYVEMDEDNTAIVDNNHIAILAEHANEGDTESMNLLAEIYLEGYGVERNKETAFTWWKRSADAGDAEGLYHIGVYYGTGDCVEQDYKLSIDYLEQAAKKGNADAIYQLGVYHHQGFGCEENWRKALDCYIKAAKKGHVNAACEAGYMLDRGGHGVRRNKKHAFKWFQKAAELDHPEAIRYVLKYLWDGIVEMSSDEENYWIEKSLNTDDPANFLQLGVRNLLLGVYHNVLFCFNGARRLGCFAANHTLGYLLHEGKDCEKDEEKALDVLMEGTLAGYKESAKVLSRFYPEKYNEIEKDLENIVDHRNLLISLVEDLKEEEYQKDFFNLVHAYEQRFLTDYQKEINKQLSIHRPSTDNSGKGGKRRIVVRKGNGKKAAYEVAVVLANGKEIGVKLNPKSLLIVLLTIICSYKNGYSTMMAKSERCKPVLAELIRLVFGDMSDKDVEKYIKYYLCGDDTNDYKQYSNLAKISMKKTVGNEDDVFYFLFDNNKKYGNRLFRTMNLGVADIELPEELARLAEIMPNGWELTQGIENQDIISE